MSDLAAFYKTLERQREAVEAMHEGDPEPYIALWSQRDPVSLFGAWGPCKTGWEELSRTFRWVGSRFSDGRDTSFEIEVAEVNGHLAYSVGYEQAQVSIDGRRVAPWKVRVTHVYRREDGDWKLVHRHGDIPPEDRSPVE
jgi:ketosteroid isomerase-like protein